MLHSPDLLFSEELAEAVNNPTFKPLNNTHKLDIERALEMGAVGLLCNVLAETVEVMKDPARFENSLSRKYATEAIETMQLASPKAQIACFGINAVREAADRLAAEMLIPVSRETGLALVNHGISANDVQISVGSLSMAAPAHQLAEAAGVTLYEVVADAWLRCGGHEWALAGGPYRTTHTAPVIR